MACCAWGNHNKIVFARLLPIATFVHFDSITYPCFEFIPSSLLSACFLVLDAKGTQIKTHLIYPRVHSLPSYHSPQP